MAFLPTIYETRTGKRYFLLRGRRIYVESDVTKKEIRSIYKTLRDNIKPVKKRRIRRRKRRLTEKEKLKVIASTIDPLLRSVAHGSNAPKDSGDKDLINKQTNELNRLYDLYTKGMADLRRQQQQGQPHPPVGPPPRPPAGPPPRLQDARVNPYHILYPPPPGRPDPRRKDLSFMNKDRSISIPSIDDNLGPSSGFYDNPDFGKDAHVINKSSYQSFSDLENKIMKIQQDKELESKLSPRPPPRPPKRKPPTKEEHEQFIELQNRRYDRDKKMEEERKRQEQEFERQQNDLLKKKLAKFEKSKVYKDAVDAENNLRVLTESLGNIPELGDENNELYIQEAKKEADIKMKKRNDAYNHVLDKYSFNQKMYSDAPVDKIKTLEKQLNNIEQSYLSAETPEEKKRFEISMSITKKHLLDNIVKQTEPLDEPVISIASSSPPIEQPLVEPLQEVKTEKEVKGEGKGPNIKNGLYDDQIDKIMSHFKDFHGVIMRDEIKKLLPHIKPQSRIAFIINTDPKEKPGDHWCAVYIDARTSPESSNSLEWFDSFARTIPSDILEDCKLILKILKPETILKVKENRVVHQSDNTANCGWFSCKFLIDRFRGKSFSDATGYDEHMKISHIKHDEAEIERLKALPPFNYIY